MSAVEFRAREYGDGESQVMASVVAGFDGKIDQFEPAINALLASGHDVVAYEYDNDILTAGHAELLPNTIAAIGRDFAYRATDHQIHRHTGASMGGGLAWNLQKRSSEVLPGLYAAAGTDVAALVMRNLPFRAVVRYCHKVDVRREFLRHGMDEADLRSAWSEIHRPPTSPFAVVWGGRDYIVRSKEVDRVIKKWDAAGQSYTSRILPRLGHTGVIKWFTGNIPAMLDLAEPLK